MTRTTATLSRLLASDNEVFRCMAAKALGRLNVVQTFDALLERLFDEDEDVSHDVAEALGRLGDARAVGPLCELYALAPFGDLKVAAVRALGWIGGNEAVDLLRRVAGERDASWNEMESEDWDSYWDAQSISIEALGRLGDEAALPVIVALLVDDEGQELAPVALKALLGLGRPGREALHERLRAGSPAQRRQVARMLGHEADGGSGEVLRSALEDKDGTVRAEALAGLTRLGIALPLELISPLLRDGDPTVRAEATDFLATLPARDLVSHWKLVLGDEQPEVRARGVRALGRMRLMPEESESSESAESPKSVMETWLGAALDDPRQEVGVCAVAALSEQGTPWAMERLASVAGDSNRESAQRVAAVNALGDLKVLSARNTFLGLLADSEPAVRLSALRMLVEQANGAAGSMLLELMQGPVNDEAITAGEDPPDMDAPMDGSALPRAENDKGADGTPDGAPDAAQDASAENEGDAEVNPPPPTSTLEAIARSREIRTTPRTLDAELEAAEFPEEDAHFLQLARENLASAEELLHPKKIPMDLHVRVEAARMLRDHPSEDSSQALVAALQSGQVPLQEAAAETAGVLGAKTTLPALIGLMSAESRLVRIAAVRALGAIPVAEAEGALLAQAPDPDPLVRREQVAALQNAQDHRSGVFLQNALHDEDPEVARTAVLTLAARGDEQALPDMLATITRHANRNWSGLGAVLSAHLPEAGCNALLEVLENPEQTRLVPAAIGILEEMESGLREKPV